MTDEDRQALQKWVNDLRSDDPRRLDDALGALGAMGPKAAGAIEVLAGMLDDDRRITYDNGSRPAQHTFQVNVSAVRVLRNIGKPAVPALTAALRSKSSAARLEAAQALSEIGQPIATEHWVRAMSDADRYVRIYAARQLGAAGGRAAVDALLGGCKDADDEAAIEAAKAVGQTRDAKAVQPLIDAVAEAMSPRRINVNRACAAAQALGRIGRPGVEALLGRFDGMNEPARSHAALAIGELDPHETKDLLLRCLKDGHPEARDAATGALARLKTPEAYRLVKGMADDPHWGVRWTVLRCLGEMADDQTVREVRQISLHALAGDADPRVRRQAQWSVYYLRGEPPPEFAPAVRAAMGDADPGVREAAATTAGKFWDPGHVPALTRLLEDPEPRVRAEAAAMLAARKVD